ncbi:D-alanine--D-alanine ligase family protein [Parapedobacter indicus]|uniref:D-alanine--D-alanine ligase n=1 Tax=Parapedobacter indicus TaxID=1477437 RepID=A0A1I3KCY6_9SPHI|nr:D-alanine--D-alanine ligase family protein [Parapedobacter indicus]PPL01785.1 D-alanine-D-alanine ligase [Parapedobacter indicus]SFI70376.1 D-alanine-D-alanine ligase [Parapedobacter indicus]
MQKKRIALVTGGHTDEFAISLLSADFVIGQLDDTKYDVYKIVVSEGRWVYMDDTLAVHPVNRADFTLRLRHEIVHFDVAFIMLHGIPGENGCFQAYLELLGIPYTSCDAATSAITMNKAYTKAVIADIDNLFVAKSVQIDSSERDVAEQLVTERLSLPYFVKPNCGGSSIGMSKVKSRDELPAALDRAFSTKNAGSQILVEEFVTGREFSVGVFKRGNKTVVLPITEVMVADGFFDYEAKYLSKISPDMTPAMLSPFQRSLVEEVVIAVYKRLACKGMVRVDFFLEDKTGKFYFIEINTIPGQTDHSFIPKQVRAAGMDLSLFYEELIEAAVVTER